MNDLTQEDIDDCEGLKYLRWSMCDSPDSRGSGKKFMEYETLYILDKIVGKYKIIPQIELGYTSKIIADNMFLATNDSHRIGKAIRVRCVGTKKRIMLIKGLIEEGVMRIAVSRDTVYFDTDNQKERSFMLW